MFQRLEKLRKNAFASVVVFGANGDSSISGVWVWRGQELAFPVSTRATIGRKRDEMPHSVCCAGFFRG